MSTRLVLYLPFKITLVMRECVEALSPAAREEAARRGFVPVPEAEVPPNAVVVPLEKDNG